MTFALYFLLFLAQPVPTSLEQVKADPHPEHRAHAAVDYAVVAEKNAESAYAKSDTPNVTASLKEMQDAIQLAYDSLEASGKRASRSPKQFKYGEQRSRELLKRLESLEQKMDFGDRKSLEPPKSKVIEIHDAWLEGIMSKQK